MSKVDSYIVLDTETGGLNSLLSPIAELGFVILDPENIIETHRYSEYVKCEKPVIVTEKEYKEIEKSCNFPKSTYVDGIFCDVAISITGIKPEILDKKGIDVKLVVEGCMQLFTEAKTGSGKYSKPVLVGHNIGYDIGMVQYMFKVCKKDLSKFIEGYTDSSGNWYPAYIDTIQMAKMYNIGLNSYNLRSVSESMSIELSNAHRAIHDVLATAEIFRKLMTNMRSGGNGSKNNDRYRKRFQI